MSNSNPLTLGFQAGIKPDPRLTITEWAERYRVLTSESSSDVGLYRVARTPFAKEIMDVLSPSDPTEQVKVIKGTQLGFSTIGDNVAMCYLDFYPCPILYIVPTETLAKGTSKRRITPSLRELPRLANKVVGGKSKDDVGEVMTKQVPGGILQFGWSQSTASFRSFSARVIILDDVDGFGSFGEGDPLALAKARGDGFPNLKIYVNSTPTLKGHSNIETEYEDSDQREYFMPCPHCSQKMVFKWEYFVFTVNDRGLIEGDVTCACPHCGSTIHEYQKTKMMADGEWIPQNEGHPYKGYKLPSFYSPYGMLSWYQIAKEFITAYALMKTGDSRLYQVWKNTRCAEVFADNLKGVTINSANERVEDYGCQVPNAVKIITAGVDTQDDRFEIEVLGHGVGGETWSIDYKVIAGDPQFANTQMELDNYLDQQFVREDGSTMKISATCVDTGGGRTKQMYDYCGARIANNIFGIKGANTQNFPVTNKTIDDIDDTDFTLIILGVSTIKDDFYARLKVHKTGNNFCHFPNLDVYNDKYFKMLTAEKKNSKNAYEKVTPRNEALDCRVYALGALAVLNEVITVHSMPVLYIGNVTPSLTHSQESMHSLENEAMADDPFMDHLNEY